MMSLSSRPALSFLAASGLAFLTVCSAGAQQAHFSTAHRNAEHTLPQSVTGGSAKLRSQLASGRAAISLIVADFDEDGTSDLVSGYAVGSGGAILLQSGNPHAQAPTPSEVEAVAVGQPVVPFASKSSVTALPIHPDLLKTADFGKHGHSGVLAAAKGDSNVYVLLGDGAGNFAAPRVIPVSGSISSVETWKGPGGEVKIAAGVCGASGCGIQILATDGTTEAFVPTSGAVTSMNIAQVNHARFADVLATTADGVTIFNGGSLLSGSPQSKTLRVSRVAATASGLFAYDRRAAQQIAVLGSDGTLHVFARSGIDNTTPTSMLQINAARSHHSTTTTNANLDALSWTEVETVPNVSSGSNAVMLRGRFSGGGYDDLAIMSGGQYVTVSNPITANGSLRTTTPTVTVDSTSSGVTSAVAARLSADSRLGVITVGSGPQPAFTVPSASRTMTVNTTTDAVPTTTSMNACKNASPGCTLRAAIAVVNADAAGNGQSHVDTVNIQPGTYTITANNGSAADSFGSFNFHFDVDGSANFVGVGGSPIVINANAIDKVFSVNSGVVNGFAPLDVFFSNMTIENGENKNNPNSGQCGGQCDYFGGNMDWDSAGPGTLGFNNVILTGGKIDFGAGGGLLASNVTTNASSASGLTEFDNSTISNNSSAERAGGVNVSNLVPFTLSSVTVTGNTASPSVNNNDPSKEGEGGGLLIEADPNENSFTAITITNSTFTSNTANDSGGAVHFIGASPVITGSTFSNNTAGVYGGAIFLDTPDTNHVATITTSTFAGNSATNNQASTHTGTLYPSNGGAICVESDTAALSPQVAIHFSRFHGNTSSASGSASGLGVGCQTASGGGHAAVNATDNWWGCNTPGTGTGCDSAINGFPATATLTLTPFTNLILNLSSTTPAGGSTFTATGSLGQDSGGTVYSLANDAAYDGVAATLTITQHDNSVTNSSATALSGLAAIATTATATASGAGTATVTVDGFAVSTGFTIPVSATKLAFTTPPTTPIALGGNPGTVKVSVEDASSNVVTSDAGRTITLTVTGPNSYSAQYTANDASGVASFSPASLSNAGTYTYTATATSLTQAVATGVVNMANQTITFTGLPASATFGSAGPYTLNGTASSGLPVTYSVTGPATLSGNTLTITGAGSVAVTASQAGNSNFNAATPVTQTINVSMASQTITFTGLPANATFGSAGPYTLNGTASSGLAVTYSVTGPATLSGNTLTITGAGSVAVTASQAGNANFSAATPVTQTINVGKANQTITFTGLPANATFGSAGPYTLNGTASSGLAVTYSVTGPATLSGNTLTITGAGSVAVTASQAGNSNYSAATPVTQTINVGKANQTITFTGLPANATSGSAGPYTLNGTASSGLPVTYSVTGPATLSGNTLTITGAGIVAVTASQAGDANYNAATPVTQTINVGGASQTITFTGLPANATFGSAGPYTLNGTASSGLPVSYTVTGPATLSGNTLTITGAGSVSVTASQAGNANFSAATPVTQTINVSMASQTITFTGLPTNATFGSAGPYALNGTASSGLPVSYTVTGPATLSGTTLTITGTGTVSVTASQAGNANFNAATPVTQTIIVSPGNQTITFTGLPASATFGSAGPYTLNGTASSGLPVSYSVSGPASLSGTTLTITGPGTVSVTAMQAGNANYNAATPVTQTIVVAASSQTITFTGLPATATFSSAGPYTLNATASSGLPVSYSVSGPATLSGTTLTITGAGTVAVTAMQGGNATFSAATPVTLTIMVGKANQTITFTGLPANATFGLAGPYTLNGTASSGLPVSYSVSGPASLSGTTLTITGTGIVAVTAMQAGDANFNAATPVTQTINVVANNGTVQLNTTAVLTKLSGGGYMAVVTVTNVGTGVAQNVDLTGVTLGSATGTPLPALLGTIAPSGGSATATVTFPASAGASGALVAERFTGTYTGGTFGGSFRATLP